MDDRDNGHGPERFSLPPVTRERLRAARAGADAATRSSLRAGEQMARLEKRIRDFHGQLDGLDAAEVDVADLSRRAASADDGLTRDSTGPSAAAEAMHAAPPEAGRSQETSGVRATSIRRIDSLRRESGTQAGSGSGAEAEGGTSEVDQPDAVAAAQARALAERITADAERQAESLRKQASAEAEELRASAESEMGYLWLALEGEVAAIQTEISRRVERLAERMEAVEREAEQIRARAQEDAERINRRAVAHAQELLAVAEQEAERFLREARRRAEGEVRPDPDRGPGERLVEQIREATAAVSRRVGLIGEAQPVSPPPPRDPVVPDTIKDVIDGLAAAVALVERSLVGLSDLVSETLGSDRR